MKRHRIEGLTHHLTRMGKLQMPLGLVLALVLGACVQTPTPVLEDEHELSTLATFRVGSRADAPDARLGDGRCATSAGVCTLRAAVQETNALPGADSVRLPEGVFRLTLGELVITDSLTLSGVSQDALVESRGRTTVIDAEDRSRVFFINKVGARPIVTLRGLTVRNGNERSSGYGAGVAISELSTVTLERLLIRDNEARSFGAGISNFGLLTVRESTVYNNKMPTNGGGGVANTGGGVFNSGLLALYDSTIYGNEATRGGGLATLGNSITVITNSTVSGNRAAGPGGGIHNRDGTVNIISSTVTRNEAFAFGRFLSLSEAYFGGGIYNTGKLALFGTLLAENEANLSAGDPGFAPDCYSLGSTRTTYVRTYGANLVGVVNDNCTFPVARPTGRPQDLLGTEASPASPMVLELADNGGPTLTHALRPYGPAKDGAGLPSEGAFTCTTNDGRGEWRPFDGDRDGSSLCDIGAFEAQEAPPRDRVAPTCQVEPSPFRPDEEVRFTFRDEFSGSGLYRVHATYSYNVYVGDIIGPRAVDFVAGTMFSASMFVGRRDPERHAYVLLVVEDAAGNQTTCLSAVPIG